MTSVAHAFDAYNSMEPVWRAAAKRVHPSIEELAGRLISRPLGGPQRRIPMREFPSLHTVGLEQSLAWLAALPQPVERVIAFGCIGSEPLALLIHLRAVTIVVLEIDRSHFTKGNGLSVTEEAELLRRLYPQRFQASSVQFVVGDMRNSPFLDSQFDLAFCKDVLYYFSDDYPSLMQALSQMVRLVRPGGWVIAVEPKFGAPHGIINTPIGRCPVAQGPAGDMSSVFESFLLESRKQEGAPPLAYCYQKPENERAT